MIAALGVMALVDTQVAMALGGVSPTIDQNNRQREDNRNEEDWIRKELLYKISQSNGHLLYSPFPYGQNHNSHLYFIMERRELQA